MKPYGRNAKMLCDKWYGSRKPEGWKSADRGWKKRARQHGKVILYKEHKYYTDPYADKRIESSKNLNNSIKLDNNSKRMQKIIDHFIDQNLEYIGKNLLVINTDTLIHYIDIKKYEEFYNL